MLRHCHLQEVVGESDLGFAFVGKLWIKFHYS